MKTKLHIDPFKDRCPSVDEFELFLKQKGNNQFNTLFSQHLKTCEFCNEAIEGYKHAGIYSIKPELKKVSVRFNPAIKRTDQLRWMGFAASVILVIGLLFMFQKYLYHNPVYLSDQENGSFIENMSHENDGIKKLNHKSSNEYWYIGTRNLEVNDQVISPAEIEHAIDKSNPMSKAVIEVGNTDDIWVKQLIQKIQDGKETPVFK